VRGDAGFPVRVRFSKQGKVRFISHRDVARAFERAVRIAEVPIAFTQGFAPRPKMSFGLALAVGHESRAEYLDVELRDAVTPADLATALSAGRPAGLTVTGAAALPPRVPALQEAVTAVAYQLGFAELPSDTLDDAAAAAHRADTLPVTTTRHRAPVVVDIRPSLRRIEVDPSTRTLAVEVSTQPRAARPGEVLTAVRALAGVESGDGEDRVLRTHQWIERDGARLEPLEADRAVPAPDGASPRALEACA
jgi:radical SAM-linked protein